MVVEVDAFGVVVAGDFVLHDFAGDADYGFARRSVFDHHGIGANAHVVTQLNRAEDFCTCADYHAVAQSWVAFALVPGYATEGHAVVEGHVVTDLGGFAYHHASPVVDEKASPDFRTGVDVDIRPKAGKVRNKTREIPPVALPQAVGDALQHDSVDARVERGNFQARTGGGVALEDAGDVFAN